MGNSLRSCRWRGRSCSRKDVVVLLVGLERAGKSRTAQALAGELPDPVCTVSSVSSVGTVSTVGFQARRLRHRGRTVRLHDVGGGAQFRAAWPHYFPDAHGLVFVLDAADRQRVPDTAALLHDVLKHPYVAGKPILILANKQDLDGAMDDLDIVEKLNIEDVVNRYRCPTRVEAYSTIVPTTETNKRYIDPGLKNGYEWLLNYIIHKYDDINLRVLADINKEAMKRLKSNNEETTGFENPNYNIEIANRETESGKSIIVVQHDMPNNENVKLSPLFGKTNVSEPIKSTVELEARPQMRKLSPIVRKRIYPMTSRESIENPERKQDKPNANEIFANQLREFRSRENLRDDSIDDDLRASSSKSKARIAEVSLGDSDTAPIFTVFKPESNKRILPPINLDNDPIRMVTPKQINNTNVEDTMYIEDAIDLQSDPDERPKSASEIVRKQLENANISNHKSNIIKGFRKNRTMPDDNTSLFRFDPENSQESNKYGSVDKPDNQSEIVVHPSL